MKIHPVLPELNDALRARLDELCAAGWKIFERFDSEVRDRRFHPFVAADYEVVRASLIAQRRVGSRFLEWGSASGVITIMADLLGYDASGIEIDESLVETARDLATRFHSDARFVAGNFLPTGFAFDETDGAEWTTPPGSGISGYMQLGRALDDFDIVFGYPWGGQERVMRDLMRTYGRADGVLLLYGVERGVTSYRGGQLR